MTTKTTLTLQQTAAFSALHPLLEGRSEFSMAVLRGFAGTGKTHLIGQLIKAVQGNLHLAVAAPTNKAVRVLREKIQQAGVTLPGNPIDADFDRRWNPEAQDQIRFGSIQSLLGIRMMEVDDGSMTDYQARSPSLHDYDAVIVDECSMIGNTMFQSIVANKWRTRVLFVGDPAQLPPIEKTSSISPTFTQVGFEVCLSEIVRQAADNPIVRLTMRIRQAIEQQHAVSPAMIAEAIPSLHQDARAAILPRAQADIAAWVTTCVRDGIDARVIAYFNDTVDRYNADVHCALYGMGSTPFGIGERVMVNQPCDAIHEEHARFVRTTVVPLINSEEAIVRDIRDERHPTWDDVPAHRLIIERDDGTLVSVFVAQDAAALKMRIARAFQKVQQLKTMKRYDEAREMNAFAWSLKKAFAPLRHVYAMTAHRSQGSTFHTAIVDYQDLARYLKPVDFNRALYVAATRPTTHLAIVV